MEPLPGKFPLWGDELSRLPDELSRLPDEVLLLTSQNLSPREFIRLCQTSKRFRPLCNDEDVWRQRYQTDFESEKLERRLTWKQNYIRHVYIKDIVLEALDIILRSQEDLGYNPEFTDTRGMAQAIWEVIKEDFFAMGYPILTKPEGEEDLNDFTALANMFGMEDIGYIIYGELYKRSRSGFKFTNSQNLLFSDVLALNFYNTLRDKFAS
jgi:hypothetical protein